MKSWIILIEPILTGLSPKGISVLYEAMDKIMSDHFFVSLTTGWVWFSETADVTETYKTIIKGLKPLKDQIKHVYTIDGTVNSDTADLIEDIK